MANYNLSGIPPQFIERSLTGCQKEMIKIKHTVFTACENRKEGKSLSDVFNELEGVVNLTADRIKHIYYSVK